MRAEGRRSESREEGGLSDADLLRAVVVAANRLMERWAEADDAVRQQLWRDLGAATTAAEGRVYPL